MVCAEASVGAQASDLALLTEESEACKLKARLSTQCILGQHGLCKILSEKRKGNTHRIPLKVTR